VINKAAAPIINFDVILVFIFVVLIICFMI